MEARLLIIAAFIATSFAFKLPGPADPTVPVEEVGLDEKSEVVLPEPPLSTEPPNGVHSQKRPVQKIAVTTTMATNSQNEEHHLPPGPIPDECCTTFCFPIEVDCICCFEDYDYFNGREIETAHGVPDFLKGHTG